MLLLVLVVRDGDLHATSSLRCLIMPTLGLAHAHFLERAAGVTLSGMVNVDCNVDCNKATVLNRQGLYSIYDLMIC